MVVTGLVVAGSGAVRGRGIGPGVWGLALLVACSAGPPPDVPAQGPAEAATAPHPLVASEEVLLHLTPTLPLLASDLVAGRMPGDAGRGAVAHTVSVRDLAPGGPAAATLSLSRLGVQRSPWVAAEATQDIARDDLSLLAPARARFETADHAKLKFVRGGFADDTRTTWTAVTAFALAGTGPDGRQLDLHGSAETTWRWLEGEGGPRWRLTAFHVDHANLTEAPAPLFVETLDARLPDPAARAAARFSRHEEKIVQHLADRTVHPDLELESFDRHPGVAVADVDGDGRDDILAMQRWGENLLLMGQADGTFKDEAGARGLALPDHCSSAVFFDMDNDGDKDVLVGRTLEPSVLLDNDGTGHFTDVTARIAGPAPRLASHVSAADLDGDGLLDLVVATYAASRIEKTWEWQTAQGIAEPYLTGLVPDAEAEELGRRVRAGEYEHFLARPGPRNIVLRNTGAGFEPVTGAGVDALRPYHNTYALAFSDIDGDGDLDAYLANDFGPNTLARNDGDWTFTDLTEQSDTADFGFGMGVGFGDIDEDGRFDLYVSNMFSKAGRRITAALGDIDPRIPKAARGNSLFRNVDGTRLERVSGTAPPDQTVEAGGWAWGGAFTDVDNDGQLDVFVLSGYYTAPWQVAREHDC